MTAAMTALVETVVALETAEDAQISADFAVALLEQIAAALRSDPAAARAFATETQRLASESANGDRKRLLATLPHALGLY